MEQSYDLWEPARHLAGWARAPSVDGLHDGYEREGDGEGHGCGEEWGLLSSAVASELREGRRGME